MTELNSVLETIALRSSIRAYKDDKLTEKQIIELKRSALEAPTAMNKQLEKHIFITNKDLLNKIESIAVEELIKNGGEDMKSRLIARNNSVLYNAPLLVLTFCERGLRFADVNSGIAVMSMALAAKSMGLDSVIIGMIDCVFSCAKGLSIMQELSIPDTYRFAISIAIGNANTEKAPHEYNLKGAREFK
ncbi:MAG: nitroreductase family protein [Clostridia bacterium]